MAVPPDDMSVVNVPSTMNIEAFASSVPDVLSVSSVELDWLSFLTSVCSDGGVSSDGKTSSHLVGENPVFVVWVSNGVGS